MILTVTLNAALDVTYQAAEIDIKGSNRVDHVFRRAGGKGVNVARVLAALGREVLVTGLAGGPTGQAIIADLDAAGLPHALAPVAGDSRMTLTLFDTAYGSAGVFNEPGPTVSPDELGNFAKKYEQLLETASAVVISGSLPKGVPADFYATLARIAADRGVPAIVDADGEPLRHAPDGHPAIMKPNHEELARAVPGGTPEEGAQALRDRGAKSVVVSMGERGLLAVTPDGTFRARMPYNVEGNPTGAGDALVAGLALGLVERTPWPERLRRAAALGAAAVAAPVAGDFDREVYDHIHPKIDITQR
ncbi:1-phosphofructokinase family hexose kinase [Nonomuraea sp. NBC_01738]|uniref:1-phosphofructokinase family hexose kinase n=1 Tax=Nonomuraea sp. NBC_01738 TaxID=2976003 RepID=UPI002E0E7D95|nr:1-phosphofructokinase family hexose kinase [Nonomuraea sp. NBC_01738]